MRVVLDTNVVISGVFFSGPPRRILEAWRDRRLELAITLAAGCGLLVSGDRRVRAASGYRGVEVVPPRVFVEKHL